MRRRLLDETRGGVMVLIKRLFVLVILLVAVYRIDVLERQVAELKAKPAIQTVIERVGEHV